MNKWWDRPRWPCKCNRGDPWVHIHYDARQHRCARCCECEGYDPDIPERVCIELMLGRDMTAVNLFLGPEFSHGA